MVQTLKVVATGSADTSFSGSEEFSPRRVSEASGTISALKLKLELGARELAQLCEGRGAPISPAFESTTELLVAAAISDRACRGATLPAGLFADPAWDMLLELFLAELRQCRISVSSLCAASQGPATTALRWIGNLSVAGLVARDPDPLDGRRYYIRLTEKGSKAMTTYFSRRPAAEGVRQCA